MWIRADPDPQHWKKKEKNYLKSILSSREGGAGLVKKIYLEHVTAHLVFILLSFRNRRKAIQSRSKKDRLRNTAAQNSH